MSKISLLYKKFRNFTGKLLKSSQDYECEVFRALFLYEHKPKNFGSYVAFFKVVYLNSNTPQKTKFCIMDLVTFTDRVVFQKRFSQKFRKIYRKTPVSVSRKPQACSFIKKETLTQVFSCEFCKNFKNTFLTEYLRETSSVIKKSMLKNFIFVQCNYSLKQCPKMLR